MATEAKTIGELTASTPPGNPSLQTEFLAGPGYTYNLAKIRVALNYSLPFTTVGPEGSGAEYECDGVSDEVELKAAWDDLYSLGGGRVYVLPGNFAISSTLVLIGSDMSLQGSGAATKFVLDDNVNHEVICLSDAITSCNNITFRDFEIDGNKANQPVSGSGLPGAERVGLRLRCDAQNCYGIRVDNIYVHDTRQNGISNESGQDVTITNCRSENNDNHGIWWENGGFCDITNNYTRGNTLAGIKVLSAGGGAVAYNMSTRDYGAGFAGQSVGSMSFIGNVAQQCGYTGSTPTSYAVGFNITLSNSVTFIGNTVYASAGDGLLINEDIDFSITGNTFRRCGQLTDNTYSDIVITNAGGGGTNQRNNIIGNTFRNDTGTGYANKSKYNINQVQANSHYNNRIADNDFGSPATSKIHNLASTDASPLTDDNSFGFNLNLNPQKHYNYGFFSNATQTIDPADGSILVGTGYLSSVDVTITDGVFRGQEFTFIFKQDNGDKQLVWLNADFPGGNSPVFSGVDDTINGIKFIWNGSTWWGLPFTDNTLSTFYENLTINNADGYAGLNLIGENSQVKILGGGTGDTTNYIESGNAAFSGNANLALTGYNSGLGATLILKFANVTLGTDGTNFALGSTTGTKLGTATSQKLGIWNATPIVQPTTGISAASFTANTSAIANDTATFGGYTIGQVVAALKAIGLLA